MKSKLGHYLPVDIFARLIEFLYACSRPEAVDTVPWATLLVVVNEALARGAAMLTAVPVTVMKPLKAYAVATEVTSLTTVNVGSPVPVASEHWPSTATFRMLALIPDPLSPPAEAI